MRKRFISNAVASGTHNPALLDALLVGALVLVPNSLLILHLHARDALLAPIPRDCIVWATANALLILSLVVLRRRLIQPLQRIAQHIQMIRAALLHEVEARPQTLPDIRRLARDVARFAQLAQEYYQKYLEASHALEESRRALAQLRQQMETVIGSTSRELALHYQSVLAYANHLEMQVVTRRIDPCLRYDFDGVCESSMNLRLITSALTVLNRASPPITA